VAPGSASRPPSLLLASLAGLVVGLVVAALWVVATVQTGLMLPELAVVVGLASAVIVRRAARLGGFGPAISAFVIAVVAIALGTLLTALSVYSAGTGVSLQSAVAHLDTALLPHLWKEIGEAGVFFGGAGVVIAPLVALIQRGAPRA
jgi:hypothetical protein